MKRIWIPMLALLLLATATARAETRLLLANGGSLTFAGGVVFDGREFVLPDGEKLSRQSVLEVQFTEPQEAGQWSWRYSPERYDALFAKGRAMAGLYPNQDTVVLEDYGEFVLFPDGGNSYDYHFTALILKEKGKACGGTAIGYDADRQQTEGPFGVVIHPDGSYRIAGDEDRTTNTPYQGMVSFNRYLVTQLKIPDLRVGDIVEYHYKITEFRPPNPDFFFPTWLFQSTDPVADSRLTVILPPGKPFHYEALNMPPDLTDPRLVDYPDGRRGFTWRLTDQPPFDPEDLMPPLPELAPSLRFTVLDDWAPIFDYLTEFYHSRMIVTPEIEKKTAEVVGDATDTQEKIARLYHFVQRKIRYISIKTDYGTGYTGHPAAVTLANEYGDCTDKAILLATMLGVIGVESHPIILHTFGGRRDIYVIPNLAGNHAINVVFLDGRKFFLDGTAETYRYPSFREDDHGRPYIDALGRTIGVIDRPPAEDNLFKETWEITLDDKGGAHCYQTITPTGFLEAGLRLALEGVSPLQRGLQQRRQALAHGANGKLLSYHDLNKDDPTKQLIMDLEFTVESMAVANGPYRIIKLPGLIERLWGISLPSRRTDLLMPFILGLESSYLVHLPAAWQIADLPAPLRLDTPKIFFEGRYQPIADGFELHILLVLRSAEIKAAQYPAYREVMIEIETFLARQVFAKEVSR